MGVRLNGIEMEWRERGEGEAILFVHGFPFNSAMWEPQLAALPPGWWGIAPDLRGFGASMDGDEEVYTMELYARDLCALLDHLEIERAVVCGLSMGGYVAFEFWRLFQDRVRALVLSDTRCDPDSAEAKQARFRLAERVRTEGTSPVVEALLPKLVALTTRLQQPGVVQFVRAMMQETPPQTMARALNGMAERNHSEPLLRTIDVPALVVMGADDVITGRGPMELLARGIRGARMETIESAGHLPNLEQPAAFNRVLSAFLTGLPTLSLPLRTFMGF